jgi:DMSO/TMAO reductase YedYZ molybdopterin-dependent catalytic subunit
VLDWSLPRAKAIQPDVLIAYQMNCRDLSPDHGFPVRAIVPGYYGMASVKWLTCIRAVHEPFHGYWQTSDYAYWALIEGKPVRRALGEMQLKWGAEHDGVSPAQPKYAYDHAHRSQ